MNRDVYNIVESYKQVLESKQPTKEQLQATKNYLKAFGLPSDDVTVYQVTQNSLQMKLPANTQNRAAGSTSNYKEVLGQLANAAQDNTVQGSEGITPGFSKQDQRHSPYYYNTYQFPNLPETIEGEKDDPYKDNFNRPRQTAEDIFNIFKSALSP